MKRWAYILLMTVCILVILVSAGIIGTTLVHDAKEQQEASDEVDRFIADIEEAAEQPESTPDPFDTIQGQTLGILFIDRLNVQAPVAAADITDLDGVDRVLKSKAAVYSNYGGIGQQATNTVFSAHSSLYPNGCGHCFFDNLEKMEQGDEIRLLWNNGILYSYLVEDAWRDQDPAAEWFYQQPEEGQQITLITCTKGNSGYRTVVRAALDSEVIWEAE